jgi:cytochrome c oxidase subunit 2
VKDAAASLLFARANPFALPADASVDGARVDALLRSTNGVVAAFLAALIVWLLWSAVGSPRLGRTRVPATSRATRMTVIAALLIALVLDGHLFLRAVSDVDAVFWNFGAVESDPNAVSIEINAHQWAWDVRYPGPDGLFNTADDVVSLNDIRVPLGAPVLVQLASTDVVHSLYLPNFRIKADAVPGSINRLWFRAKETGTFEVACAQHCGVNHYKMRGEIAVLSVEDYRRWYRSASERAARAYDPRDTEAHWGWAWKKSK